MRKDIMGNEHEWAKKYLSGFIVVIVVIAETAETKMNDPQL